MKTINKNTVEAIARLIEDADKQKQNFIPKFKTGVETVVVSQDGMAVSPIDVALLFDDPEALRLITILSNSFEGTCQTNELDNASRDIAHEMFGQNVRRVFIWTRRQCKNALALNINVDKFENDVVRVRQLFLLIDELYDNNGFIVTGIY